MDSNQIVRPVAIAGGVTALLLALVPLLLVTYPPLQDLPNHLARIFILGLPPGHPLLDHYQPDWRPLPNLVTDVLLLGLAKIMPLALAAKFTVALIALGWLVAPMLLHWAIYRRHAVTPLLAAPFVFNQALQMAFLNFLLGTGLAVICFAIWVLLTNRRLAIRITAALAMGLLIYFSHLFAFAIFLIAIGIWELAAPSPPRGRLWLLASALLPALALYMLGKAQTSGQVLMAFQDWDGPLAFLAGRARQLIDFVATGDIWSLLTIGATTALLAASLAFARTRPDRRTGIICAVLALLFLLMPGYLLGGSNVDWRMLAPLILFVAGWITLDLGRRASVAIAVVLIGLASGETVVLAQKWQAGEALYRDFELIAAQVPVGATVAYSTPGLGTDGNVPGATSVLHFHGYLVIERQTVDPAIFALPGQQPLRRIDASFPATAADYDYALVASMEPTDPPADGTEVATTGIFRLYKLTR